MTNESVLVQNREGAVGVYRLDLAGEELALASELGFDLGAHDQAVRAAARGRMAGAAASPKNSALSLSRASRVMRLGSLRIRSSDTYDGLPR